MWTHECASIRRRELLTECLKMHPRGLIPSLAACRVKGSFSLFFLFSSLPLSRTLSVKSIVRQLCFLPDRRVFWDERLSRQISAISTSLHLSCPSLTTTASDKTPGPNSCDVIFSPHAVRLKKYPTDLCNFINFLHFHWLLANIWYTMAELKKMILLKWRYRCKYVKSTLQAEWITHLHCMHPLLVRPGVTWECRTLVRQWARQR